MTPTWEREGIKLCLADCHDVPVEADAIVTDPPYGINHNTNYKRFTGGLSQSRNFGLPIHGDNEPFDPTPWLKYPKVILWGANCFSDRLPLGSLLVWIKKRDNQLGTIMSDAEVAWQKGGHGVYVFNHTWNGFDRASERGQKSLHPTQKPVALMRWCIERLKLKPGSVIFDPYAGSAPVGQAAIELGHQYIGIEREPVHFETAVNRLTQVLDNKLLAN